MVIGFVPKEVQNKLFTKFHRADNARRLRPDGNGLGLHDGPFLSSIDDW